MWLDESGGTDPDASGTAGMTVHVEGEDYSTEVNYDLDGDGVQETAIIQRADGSAQAFVDSDRDGVADRYAVADAGGKVVEQATYDQASGHWVETGDGRGGDDGRGDQQNDSGGTIHADMPKGDVEVGPATVDTNHDGVNDTAVVSTRDGGTIAFTDTGGDGQADIAVETDASGQSRTYQHTGKGDWTEQRSGLIGAPDSDAVWGGGTDNVEGIAKIDSSTGQWISPN